MSEIDGLYSRISIKDQGIGIPKEQLSKIFDPYYTTKEKGIGLGLTIALSIVNRHDGLITVESERNIGTIFHIYIPMIEQKIEIMIDKKQIIKGSGRILFIDDEYLVREATGLLLDKLGYEVVLSSDCKEALSKIQKAKDHGELFNAIITDLTIPGGMGGKEFIEKFSNLNIDSKVIVSSGYSNDPIMAEHQKYGFSGVLIKPYTIQELSTILHNILELND